MKTYQSYEGKTVNSPYEFKLWIEDVNHDGYNDLIFSGYIALLMAVEKNNIWHDGEVSGNKTKPPYSRDSPFRKIPVKLVFYFDAGTGLFKPKGPYLEYCTDNLYKLVYHIR